MKYAEGEIFHIPLGLNYTKVDTILNDNRPLDYNKLVIKYEYETNITATVYQDWYFGYAFEFGALSREEIWPLLLPLTDNFNEHYVIRNWVNEVQFVGPEAYCTYVRKKKNGVFNLRVNCNC